MGNSADINKSNDTHEEFIMTVSDLNELWNTCKNENFYDAVIMAFYKGFIKGQKASQKR